LTFDVLPSQVDEAEIKLAARAEGMSAADTALTLADLKAGRVAGRAPQALVIGADQILVCDGAWFDKPADRDAARHQLLSLRGKAHVLATAVVCHHDTYLAAEGEMVTSTVGAYRLECRGVHLFERIDGDHAAILGLPLLPLLSFLRQHGALAG
jgi:septum formation protein